MTMYVYHGYKDGKHVATIEAEDLCWLIWPPDASWSAQVRHVFQSIRAAKVAWRRIDGPGTTWRPY